MAEKHICPHCGSVGYSAYENATCHQCGKRPDDPIEEKKEIDPLSDAYYIPKDGNSYF